MKILAQGLAFLLGFPVAGWTAGIPDPSVPPYEVMSSSTLMEPFPITVTAPRSNETRALKTARAAGAGAGTAGMGLMAYAFYAGAVGPIGWAAALFIMGGMTIAYLSNRRLQGYDDFTWDHLHESEPEFPSARPGGSAVAPQELERRMGRLDSSRDDP